MYNIDYNILIRSLLPTFLRQPIIIAFLRCLISPIIWLYNAFLRARENDLFRESIDSTIPRLEFMLNTIFYPAGLDSEYNYRIKISLLGAKTSIYIFLLPEGKPQYIFTAAENRPKYIYTPAEAGQVEIDFIVNVPIGIEYDEVRMRSLVRSYCLPDKSFEIINY